MLGLQLYRHEDPKHDYLVTCNLCSYIPQNEDSIFHSVSIHLTWFVKPDLCSVLSSPCTNCQIVCQFDGEHKTLNMKKHVKSKDEGKLLRSSFQVLENVMVLPSATYSSPDLGSKFFEVDPSELRYQTTNGKTTGPSPHVLNAGQVDRDRPSDPRRSQSGEYTSLGQLRAQLTGLQDDINEFLTERMELAKRKKTKLQKSSAEQERRIQEEISELLDGGDGDEDDDENENENDDDRGD